MLVAAACVKTMLQDKGENLKLKLKSVTKLKLKKAREELALCNTERNFSEELRTIQAENEFMFHQLQELKQEISKSQYQLSVIGICEASEKYKIENHITNIMTHKNGYEQVLLREMEAIEFHKMEIKRTEAHEKELEQQKQKDIELKNQLQLKEALMVEKECDSIEQECTVLKKRNKAIMLKLRRRLIESEELRRNLTRTVETNEMTERKE